MTIISEYKKDFIQVQFPCDLESLLVVIIHSQNQCMCNRDYGLFKMCFRHKWTDFVSERYAYANQFSAVEKHTSGAAGSICSPFRIYTKLKNVPKNQLFCGALLVWVNVFVQTRCILFVHHTWPRNTER